MTRPDSDDRIAVAAIQEIYKLWQIDEDRSLWVGDKPSPFLEPYGFDWWPGDYKVAVRIFGPHPEWSPSVYRLSVKCDFLKDVDISAPSFLKNVSEINSVSPTFSLVSMPQEVVDLALEKYDLDPRPLNVWLESTAYLHEDISEWIARFLAGQAILQPIESQERAILAAELLGGRPDQSSRPGSSPNRGLDEMLGLENDYAACGELPSKWIGTGEFEEIIDRWGRCNTAFGTADQTGLTIETPFGEQTAILTLKTEVPRPRLGNGLLATLRIPYLVETEKAPYDANFLNFLEATTWAGVGMPLTGSWATLKTHDPELMCLAYSSFFPNFVYSAGLAENVVLWGINRARWVHEIRHPDIKDLPMYDILSRRFERSDSVRGSDEEAD